MKIVLLKDISKVGRKGETVDVSDGYATNSLFPRKLAVLANTAEGKRIISEYKAVQDKRSRDHEKIISSLQELKGKVFKVSMKANEKGVLFDAFDQKDLLKLLGDKINKEHFLFNGLPIKNIGLHEVSIKSAQDKKEITKISIEI